MTDYERAKTAWKNAWQNVNDAHQAVEAVMGQSRGTEEWARAIAKWTRAIAEWQLRYEEVVAAAGQPTTSSGASLGSPPTTCSCHRREETAEAGVASRGVLSPLRRQMPTGFVNYV